MTDRQEKFFPDKGKTRDNFANAVNGRIVPTTSGEYYLDWRNTPLSAGVSAGNHSSLGNLNADDHCFSEDTELLTRDGFIPYTDITEDHEALTLNLESKVLEYNKIKAKYVYDSFTASR